MEDTDGVVTCLGGERVVELGGDGGGLEEAAPADRLVRAAVVVVVVRLEVLLADEELAEDVGRSVDMHVQSKQPLLQSHRVAEGEPVEGDAAALRGEAVLDATPVHHLCLCPGFSGRKGDKSDTRPQSLSGRCTDFKHSAVLFFFFFCGGVDGFFFFFFFFREILPPFVRNYKLRKYNVAKQKK